MFFPSRLFSSLHNVKQRATSYLSQPPDVLYIIPCSAAAARRMKPSKLTNTAKRRLGSS